MSYVFGSENAATRGFRVYVLEGDGTLTSAQETILSNANFASAEGDSI
jgi:hypothetical protein